MGSPLIPLLDCRDYNTARKEGWLMFTTTTTGGLRERAALCLSRFSEKHPLGTFLFLFVVPPAGMLMAVTLFTAVLSLPLALLFGWL